MAVVLCCVLIRNKTGHCDPGTAIETVETGVFVCWGCSKNCQVKLFGKSVFLFLLLFVLGGGGGGLGGGGSFGSFALS